MKKDNKFNLTPSTKSNLFLPTIKKAKGKYCWDVNGKKYLDFMGSNLTVIEGHKKYKFNHTPNYSGKSVLENDASRLLYEFTGNLHYRFFKNGTDAISCALRLARSLYGTKAKVGFLGYHGTNNDYMITTTNKDGIPDNENCIQIDTNDLKNNRIDILIFESRYKTQAHKIKAEIKICDHLKSGINGLWEEQFDIDLYGKNIANGYPIAVMTGTNSIMENINKIYYSTTFGGENVGLEALIKTIKSYNRYKWLNLKNYADKNLPKWNGINSLKMKEFQEKGILFNGYWQIMTCHTKRDIDHLKNVYNDIM